MTSSTATLLSTIATAPTYIGTGTIVVAPNLTAALAMGSSSTLNVIQGPFGPGSMITQVAMPGVINGYQTQAIVFNNAGRAFVYHSTGISVLDAPIINRRRAPFKRRNCARAIPGGNTLMANDLATNIVRSFKQRLRGIELYEFDRSGRNGLDGIMGAPNGARQLLVHVPSGRALIAHLALVGVQDPSGSLGSMG